MLYATLALFRNFGGRTARGAFRGSLAVLTLSLGACGPGPVSGDDAASEQMTPAGSQLGSSSVEDPEDGTGVGIDPGLGGNALPAGSLPSGGTGDMSVCPSCKPHGGGQTSDFDTDVSSCTPFYVEAPTDMAQELGFDLESLRAQLELPTEAAFRWEKRERIEPTDLEAQEGSYTPETRVRTTAKSGSARVWYLNPEQCDGVQCVGPEGPPIPITVDCVPYVEFDIDMMLETLDGAIRVNASGVAMHWVLPDRSYLGSYVLADLTTVTGSLRLAPTEHVGSAGASVYINTLIEPEHGGSVSFSTHPRPSRRSSLWGIWRGTGAED